MCSNNFFSCLSILGSLSLKTDLPFISEDDENLSSLMWSPPHSSKFGAHPEYSKDFSICSDSSGSTSTYSTFSSTNCSLPTSSQISPLPSTPFVPQYTPHPRCFSKKFKVRNVSGKFRGAVDVCPPNNFSPPYSAPAGMCPDTPFPTSFTSLPSRERSNRFKREDIDPNTEQVLRKAIKRMIRVTRSGFQGVSPIDRSPTPPLISEVRESWTFNHEKQHGSDGSNVSIKRDTKLSDDPDSKQKMRESPGTSFDSRRPPSRHWGDEFL